jgi:dTDP-4-amino-4,6-dideoxygalactose transaminase
MLPLVDLAAQHRSLQGEILAAVQRILGSGQFILGPEVETFEAQFADWIGAPHAIGVSNGIDALRLVLVAMGIGPGDEVILPANTFIGTALAVSQVGARPLLRGRGCSCRCT